MAFVFGVLIGVTSLAFLVLVIKLVVKLWRRYWSLDRRWKRVDDCGVGAEALNAACIRLIFDSGQEAYKELSVAVNRSIRKRVAAASFMYKILPPEHITVKDLDRQVDTGKSVKIIDINKAHSPPRCRVYLDRIITPKVVVDIDDLKLWCDVRQLFLKSGDDMAYALDSHFIAAVSSLLQEAGKEVPETGKVQWRTIRGGINRHAVAYALRTLATPLAVVLVNDHFVDEMTFKREIDEETVGYDGAGVVWIVTKKHDLVPDGTMFLFGAPEKLGRHFILEDVTAWFDKRAFKFEYFVYTSTGVTISHVRAVARVDFVGQDGLAWQTKKEPTDELPA